VHTDVVDLQTVRARRHSRQPEGAVYTGSCAILQRREQHMRTGKRPPVGVHHASRNGLRMGAPTASHQYKE